MFTLRDRLIAYYAQAPDEQLTVEDIRRKLGHNSTALIRAVVQEARDDGWLFLREVRGELDRREVQRLVCLTPEARDVLAAPLARADKSA